MIFLNASEVISDLRRQDVEILTEKRLEEVIEEIPRPVTYIGLEPSNSLHIGNLSASIPVMKLAKHGFRAIILLADLHALANDKGEIEEIRRYAKFDKAMYEKIASKMGIGGKLEYKHGTEFEDQEYFMQLLRLAKHVNLTEAEKAMDEISKASVTAMTSSIIYPLMQALDIGVLGVNVAVGAMDQRKVHVLAIENLKRLGYRTPVAIHGPIMLGTDGKKKMSKSEGNAIFLNETEDSLEAKIKKTYCAPGDVEINPILSWYRAMIFPLSDSAIEFGAKKANEYKDLEAMWKEGRTTPQELKRSAKRDLGKLIL